MEIRGVRDFVALLDERGDVLHIADELSPRFEIPAVLREISKRGGPAVLFEQVLGYPDWRIVGNLLGTAQRLALAFGVTRDEVMDTFLTRRQDLIPPVMSPESPVHEIVVERDIDLSTQVPILTHNALDAGPVITAGACIAKSPKAGNRSMGLHRLQALGKNQLSILLVNPPLTAFFREAEEGDVPLEIAIVIGACPAALFGSILPSPSGADKLEMAGGLQGSAVRLARAKTVDVEVPCDAEVVIEGKVLPRIRARNGPFGEANGYYHEMDAPVIEVTAIARRRDPIYHAIMPTSAEMHVLSNAFTWESFKRLQSVFPSLTGVNLLFGSHLVLSMKPRARGEARRAVYHALSIETHIKRVTVVDDDVDITDPAEVEWAIATRSQADDDVVVMPNVDGLGIDPSVKDGFVTAKFGIDATKPWPKADKLVRADIPADAASLASRIAEKYLQP